MQVRVKKQNINNQELAKALSSYIHAEGIGIEVLERLEKSQHKEPIPEKYIETIINKLNSDFRSLFMTLNQNLDKWLSYQSKPLKKGWLRKSGELPPILSQEQIEELKLLIESHFRMVIGIIPNTQNELVQKWKKIGIEMPDENIEQWIRKAYIAGRLANVLNNGSSYAEMLKMAKKLPMSRLDELTLSAAKQNAAKYITGYGEKLASLAEQTVMEQHKSAIHDVIQGYFSGELKHTQYNGSGFSPEETERLLSTNKNVMSWKELSTELKNRFKATDIGRDWDRVSVTETRYATNMGRIMNIQVEGGGDPEEIEVYYHVQPEACKHCKELYLEPDGTPKIFKLSEILANIQETGGMNVGRKASLIGQEGGYLPNASTHPWCHCYPVRKIKGYKMIPRGDVRDAT